ncbi:MAG TPA: cbb3-type cytochrome c oxidase N-terminal domain-containing protein [Gemmatimonadaceae bacterium]
MNAVRQEPNRGALLDHDADGIRELDNALPRWWLYGFYFTIAFAVVYMTNYHALRTPLWGEKGMVAEYEAELRAAPERPAPAAPAGAAPLVALADGASLERGRAIFEGPDNVCSSCHRPDLGGLIGPNLTDDYWRHGCTTAAIVSSIMTGYPLKGMLPFGTGNELTDAQVLEVASYVISKRGTQPANPKPIDESDDIPCR